MSKSGRVATLAGLGLLTLAATVAAGAADRFPGIGRRASDAEIRAWDIDVRPDFQGLPKGSGSVARGQEIWDERCASCHGTFGESNAVFPPIVGGTTAEDVKRGRVAALQRRDEQRTTLMKLASVSVLWDYVNRAMPWDRPKSLAVDEVYAVVAYMLHLGDLVPADFVLSEGNIRDVQARLPNRDGLTRNHGLWDVAGKPDVNNSACMRDCGPAPRVISSLPERVRNMHGDLFEQHRFVGPVRGADTTRPPATGRPGEAGRVLARRSPGSEAGISDGPTLAQRHACVACHALDHPGVGPAFRDIAAKYRTHGDATTTIEARIRTGGTGVWGTAVMPPQAHVADADVQALARWIATELR
jgi:S-disulfanyl-L-cysteine oxidoreductase SoxD